MIKSFVGLFLALVLLWPFVAPQAEPSFYHSLINKIGVLKNNGNLAQYANVTFCGKTVSVTANHVVEEIDKLKPNSNLLAADRKHDLAIYESLGNASPSPLALVLPSPFEEIYVPTFVWMNEEVVVFRYFIMGYGTREVLVQGTLFFGQSGSGTYNKNGEYLGPVLNILSARGYTDGTRQQAGIGGIGRTDKLIELFIKEICNK